MNLIIDGVENENDKNEATAESVLKTMMMSSPSIIEQSISLILYLLK